MSTEPETEVQKALPQTNFFDKAIEMSASFDRLMVTLYSALIAGIVVMLLKEEVSLWVGAPLFVSLVCFAIGIGHTLLHIAFMSKVLFLAEALANRTQVIPNAVEEDEPTVDAYVRNKAYAQRSYSSQLIYLVVGVGFSAVAVVFRLWEYAYRAGVVGLIVVATLFAIVTFAVTWKNTLRRFKPSMTAKRRR